MIPDVCIYHDNCLDGFTAAWAIWKRWPDIEFIAANYGQAPPDVAGKKVLIVDFSYKRDVLVDMSLRASGILVLDHHKTAKEDLAPFESLGAPFSVPLTAHFDMEKSGARLAWEYAHATEPGPKLAKHVEDRDLWRFVLPFTREINAYLGACDYTFPSWSSIAEDLEDDCERATIVIAGGSIMRQQAKDRAAVIRSSMTMRVIAGHLVPVVNAPHFMASEIGNDLAPGHPFAACYYDTGSGKRAFSLRSTDAGEDVSAICAKFGGGGHRNAAGFAVDLDGFTWGPV